LKASVKVSDLKKVVSFPASVPVLHGVNSKASQADCTNGFAIYEFSDNMAPKPCRTMS
jgi:hypothetical protein